MKKFNEIDNTLENIRQDIQASKTENPPQEEGEGSGSGAGDNGGAGGGEEHVEGDGEGNEEGGGGEGGGEEGMGEGGEEGNNDAVKKQKISDCINLKQQVDDILNQIELQIQNIKSIKNNNRAKYDINKTEKIENIINNAIDNYKNNLETLDLDNLDGKNEQEITDITSEIQQIIINAKNDISELISFINLLNKNPASIKPVVHKIKNNKTIKPLTSAEKVKQFLEQQQKIKEEKDKNNSYDDNFINNNFNNNFVPNNNIIPNQNVMQNRNTLLRNNNINLQKQKLNRNIELESNEQKIISLSDNNDNDKSQQQQQQQQQQEQDKEKPQEEKIKHKDYEYWLMLIGVGFIIWLFVELGIIKYDDNDNSLDETMASSNDGDDLNNSVSSNINNNVNGKQIFNLNEIYGNENWVGG